MRKIVNHRPKNASGVRATGCAAPPKVESTHHERSDSAEAFLHDPSAPSPRKSEDPVAEMLGGEVIRDATSGGESRADDFDEAPGEAGNAFDDAFVEDAVITDDIDETPALSPSPPRHRRVVHRRP